MGTVFRLPDIRRVLSDLLRHPALSTQSHINIQFLTAVTWIHEGKVSKAAAILQSLYKMTHSLRGVLRVEILSALARTHLMDHQPHMALPVLIEATRHRTRGRGWESAMYNLGLTWWKLGQYNHATTQWQETDSQVADPELKAHANVGLGNAALSRSCFGSLSYGPTSVP